MTPFVTLGPCTRGRSVEVVTWIAELFKRDSHVLFCLHVLQEKVKFLSPDWRM